MKSLVDIAAMIVAELPTRGARAQSESRKPPKPAVEPTAPQENCR